MPRVILKNPFMRHYAGSIFDLEENLSWDKDQDRYERITPERNYILPDNGRGYHVDLSFSDTVLCPPSVFDGVDLTTGPCRITSVKANDAVHNWGENNVVLFENKQGLSITDLFNATQLAIFDRKTNQMIQEKTISTTSIFLDFSAFSTGFYEIKIFCKNGILCTINFIKCFPLVIADGIKAGQFKTMKTIW